MADKMKSKKQDNGAKKKSKRNKTSAKDSDFARTKPDNIVKTKSGKRKRTDEVVEHDPLAEDGSHTEPHQAPLKNKRRKVRENDADSSTQSKSTPVEEAASLSAVIEKNAPDTAQKIKPGKKSKRKQKKGDAKLATATAFAQPPDAKDRQQTEVAANLEASNGQPADAEESTDGPTKAKAPRFIVFVGNLPFTTTSEALSKHFKKIEPKDIRHMTAKGSNKSKGFAFLEFDRFDKMKTCLSLYHHTLFDDGISPARKINVELTAGGGGSNASRKAKLKAKNEKLTAERKRKFREQANQKGSKGTKDGAAEADEKDKHAGMHPSRRARLES